MARAAGLDVGRRFTKAAVVEGNSREWRLSGFAMRETPPPAADGVPDLAFAADLLRSAGWRDDPVGVTLHANETALREMCLPFKDRAQLEKVLRFEAENHLPFPAEEAVIDFTPVETDADGTRLIALAARKATLAGSLRALNGAGIDPVRIGAEPLALVDALRAGAALPPGRHLLLDLGATSAKAALLNEGRIVSLRVLRFGDTAAGSCPYVEKLARELRRLPAFGVSGAMPEAATLTGGYATEDAARQIAAALDVPARVLSLPEGSPLRQKDSDAPALRGGVAVGVALAALGTARQPVYFRRDEFRRRARIEQIRGPTLFLLGAAALFFVLSAAAMELRRQELRRAERDLAARERALWQELSPGAAQPEDLAGWMQQERARLTQTGGGPGARAPSAFGTLRAILAAVPPSVELTVRSVNITPDRARIEMAVDSPSAAAETVKAVSTRTAWAASPRNLRYEEGRALFELDAVPQKEATHAQ